MAGLQTDSITVTWKVDKLNELFGLDQDSLQRQTRESPPFDRDRWLLRLKTTTAQNATDHSPHHVSIYLHAQLQEDERADALWSRVDIGFSIEVCLPSTLKRILRVDELPPA
ncbi:hypothetical protein JCM10213v2_001008 [Rhodosporidiobolus nylandii]